MTPNSPKAAFLTTSLAKAWAQLGNNPAVLAALDAAMLQMQYELYGACGAKAETAAALAFRMEGAWRFKDILLRIAEKDKPVKLTDPDNLPFQGP